MNAQVESANTNTAKTLVHDSTQVLRVVALSWLLLELLQHHTCAPTPTHSLMEVSTRAFPKAEGNPLRTQEAQQQAQTLPLPFQSPGTTPH